MKELMKKLGKGPQSINWSGLLSVLLLVALVVPVIMMSPTSGVAPRAQPILLELATERPDDTVGVIVQKLGQDATAEGLVARLGGVVTKDLHIIHAFAAELPAGAVPDLALAAGVRWVSLDAPVVQAGKGGECEQCIDTSNLLGAYVQAIGATRLWNEEGTYLVPDGTWNDTGDYPTQEGGSVAVPYLQGQGITVAAVDSGIAQHQDLTQSNKNNDKGNDRVLTDVKLNDNSPSVVDEYGHGTHIAGIIGGNGEKSRGAYIGVAPKVSLVNIKVSDDRGAGSTSEVIEGLQWLYDHKDEYNIRVVNLSLNSSVPESYHTNPLDAALEILWFNGIVVVVAAGNNGDGLDNGILYPPANDPFVITVGAADDMGTVDLVDDALAPFSAYGTTESGFAKPDLVAPGTHIISLLASNGCDLAKGHPDHRVDGFAGGRDYYFRMSGTSMASAVTSGAVALLLQDEPNLTPDQVKYRLMATARPFDSPGRAGAGYLDIYAAVHGTTTESANTGIEASQLLWTGSEPVMWDSVNWNSVNWNSVNWNSVNWNSVNWNSVNWNSVNWND